MAFRGHLILAYHILTFSAPYLSPPDSPLVNSCQHDTAYVSGYVMIMPRYCRTAKTTEGVSRRYYWPGMRETIKRYIKNCDIGQWSKVVCHESYGMLQPNKVPDQPWKSIAMDFITDHLTSDGHDRVLVVIDRLIKISHFISCNRNLDSRQFATLCLTEIIWLHSILRDIITDRGSQFTSDLWK